MFSFHLLFVVTHSSRQHLPRICCPICERWTRREESGALLHMHCNKRLLRQQNPTCDSISSKASTSLLAASCFLATLVAALLFSILRRFIYREVALELLTLSRRPPICRFWPQQVLHVRCRDRRRGIKLPEEVVEGLLLHMGRARVLKGWETSCGGCSWARACSQPPSASARQADPPRQAQPQLSAPAPRRVARDLGARAARPAAARSSGACCS